MIVLYLVLGLTALGLVSAAIGMLSHNKDGSNDVINNDGVSCSTCSGNDPRCEQECMIEAATKPVEYFDDEELDSFRERPSDRFTDDEAEMFREVLYTMKPEEVKDWCRSLTLRGINLPDQVKDEVFMIWG